MLMASVQVAQLASAQTETWFIPRYNNGQLGTINWNDALWASASGSSGPWVEDGQTPGINILPNDENKVIIYYGTQSGPVTGLLIDSSTNVMVTGLLPRFETLYTTEFIIDGSLTLTGKTQSEAGALFTDLQSAKVSVNNGGTFTVSDASGTFGVSSSTLSSFDINGGTASFNSSSGAISVKGLNSQNEGTINVTTSISEDSSGGNATLEDTELHNNAIATVSAQGGSANVNNLNLTDSQLVVSALDSSQSANIDTLTASGTSKINISTSDGTINLTNLSFTGNADNIGSSLITLSSDIGGINIKNSEIANATVNIQSNASGWRNGFFQNLIFKNSSISATMAGENWIPLNMTLDQNSKFLFTGEQGRLFLTNDENVLSNTLTIANGSSMESSVRGNYLSTTLEGGLVKLALNDSSFNGEQLFVVRTTTANSKAFVEAKNKSTMNVHELKFIMRESSNENSTVLINVDSSSRITASMITATSAEINTKAQIDIESGSMSGSWIKLDIDSSLQTDSPLISLTSSSGINAEAEYLGFMVDFSAMNTSLADDTYVLISADQASLQGIIAKVYVKTSSGKIVEVSADENGLFVHDGEGLEDSFQFYVTGGEFGLSAYSFVPEPSVCATLTGVLSLLLALYRRKK